MTAEIIPLDLTRFTARDRSEVAGFAYRVRLVASFEETDEGRQYASLLEDGEDLVWGLWKDERGRWEAWDPAGRKVELRL